MGKPKVVILCGGRGTRLQEETEFKPKGLVSIGEKPILWHIMKTYSHYGFNDFILCLGYKGDLIKDFFLNYRVNSNDFKLNLKTKKIETYGDETENWNIIFANTGIRSQTGSRLKQIEKYITQDNFFMTYGDCLGDVNIKKLFDYHNSHGKIGTVTAVRPVAKLGKLELIDGLVVDFTKKSLSQDSHVDGGFCVFKREFFKYLSDDENCVLEDVPLKSLSKDREFMAYQHDGSWQCMDTISQTKYLNDLWESGKAFWKVW
jgi:glucose-1-phosphate cytidylyltransferase